MTRRCLSSSTFTRLLVMHRWQQTARATESSPRKNDSSPNLPDVTMNFLGAVATFERWAELDECNGSPSEPDADGCSTYSDCADGTEVTLCTVEGGGCGMGKRRARVGNAFSALEALSDDGSASAS